MKRIPELRGLSEDHHHGLVLARKAKKAAAGKDLHKTTQVWTEVERKFQTDLEPHFQIEENFIAPFLEIHGESELVKQLHTEHEALRDCLAPGSGRLPADLQRFGMMLEKHIRFEEREFFAAAQKCLSQAVLQRVDAACKARGDGA